METKHYAGFLLVNKPVDITSFAVVKHLRVILGRKERIGHTGTLDPFATGLLIIAIDRSATKHCEKFLMLDKVYYGTGKLGELTDSLDQTGLIERTEPYTAVSKKDITDAITSFGASYLQTAPLFASLKHNGPPLHKLARQKKLTPEQCEAILKTKRRIVELYTLKLLDFSSPFFTIEAHVSRGTYIRSLINDIAKRAGTVATSYELERTAIGPFAIEHAQNMETFKTYEDIEGRLIPIDQMLAKLAEYKNSCQY